MRTSADNRVFTRLDAMRGVAAIVVAAAHCGSILGSFAIPAAGIAVDTFFAISGFVIAYSYERRLQEGSLGCTKFMLIRFVRLYPMYAIGVLVSLALPIFLSVGHAHKSAVFNALMIPSPLSEGLYPLNGPGWSLFYELVINAAYGAVLAGWSTRRLIFVAAASAFALIGLSMSGYSLDGGWNWNGAPVAFARVAFAFIVGVILFRTRSESGAGRWSLPIWAIIVVIAFMTYGAQFYRLPLVLLAVPAFVFVATYGENFKTSTAAGFLGKLSYPLYATHYPLIVAVMFYLGPDTSADSLLLPALTLALVVIFAILVQRTLDDRLRSILGRALGLRDHRAPIESARLTV